jgi:hypothetical protein
MPMKQAELTEEVELDIMAALVDGRAVKKSWIKHAIMERHQAIDGPDRDWFILCATEHIDRTVNRVLSHYTIADTQTDAQLVMPGCERLQRVYLVERHADSTLVPIGSMTDEEIEQKVADYRAMGDGCYAHADELGRYLKRRRDERAGEEPADAQP